MTSNRLWLLLTVLAAPLVLYATTGCETFFPLVSPPPTTNAYTCGCECNPGNRDITKPIAVDQDDAEERRSDTAVVLGNADLRMTNVFLVGLRFAAVGIPQGATIVSAYVQFTAAQTDANPATIAIRIEDSADAPPFAGTNTNISSRSSVLPPVSWTSPAWTSGDQMPPQQTSDLKDLIQSVVSKTNWSEASALVLIFDATSAGHVAVSADGAANREPVLHVTYFDPAATVAVRIPVCLNEDQNPFLNPNATNPDGDGDSDNLPDVLASDCANRVENTYRGLVGACGYVPNPTQNCNCDIVETGFRDENEDTTLEPYYGFTREICNVGPPVCAEVELDTDPGSLCSNFDPKGFADCIVGEQASCAQNSIPPEDCNIDDCLPLVSATNVSGADPICIAHASEAPAPLAFQLFGRRSTCQVEGLTEIAIGPEGREPKRSPITRGTLEIFGGPCPGAECVVGVSTQIAMNPISFAVSWARDPKFNDLIESGNSTLGAGSLSALGVGTLATGTTANVGRGRRGSNKKAFLGTNPSPLGLTVNWGGFTCSLDGNLGGAVNAEGVPGTCQGDETVGCLNDSPDCDDAGGPCNFPADEQGMVVDVSLDGTLTNQPPTADAGDDQTIECTSPAGAAFTLDGSESSDPDGDIRIVSWRADTRVGPEVGFTTQLPGTLGVGDSQTFVLRVIDGFAQADEDAATAAVVDTTPPDVVCNAPATIPPPNKPISFTATATDICTAGAIVPALVDLECFKLNAKGDKIDKTKTCKTVLTGATATISPPQGVGQHIAWTARAVDPTGNVGTKRCEIEVVKK